jgi:uncharacterized membrane protein YedE/YeeE
MLAHGRVAGISGLFGGFFRMKPGDRGVAAAFLAGLVGAGLAARLFAPAAIGASGRGVLALALAGLLVGFGTQVGAGCTSGHGVCGLSRGSLRSLVATMTFIMAGVATVAATRALGLS